MIWAAFMGLSWVWRLAIVGVVVASLTTTYVLWRNSVWNEGHAAAMAEVEAANKEMADAARKAVNRARDCRNRGLVWDQSSGQCSGGL